jgi:broad specificity phosphatase PhoE
MFVILSDVPSLLGVYGETMAATIVLIRHGETAWNRKKVFRGTYDIPLNDNGRRQAELLAGALQRYKIEAAYTSPLSRARETADIALQNRDIEAVPEPGLIDFSYGDWTGLEEADVAKRWPDEHHAWITRPETLRVPGGDTLAEVHEKAFGAMEEIAVRHDGQTVALFAHRVVNKLLVLGALGLELRRFGFIRQDNCCTNEFERTNDGYVIVSLNDTSHLRRDGVKVLTADF